MAFLALGDIIAATLLQTGRFTHGDAQYVWGILAGSSVGLLASTLGRLYSSTYYALRDTRTPLRYAVIRVVLTTGLGYLGATVVPPLLGIDLKWGTAGLTASAGVAGWIEFALLRRSLNRRIGATGLPRALVARLWGAAIAAALAAWAIKLTLPLAQPVLVGVVVLLPYGVVYVGMTLALGVPEARTATRRLMRRRG
jgi:putative peptidoglycan lipid II flippase